MLEEPWRSLDIVEALDFVAAGRVKQTRQQLLSHVHLKQVDNESFLIKSVCLYEWESAENTRRFS